MLDPDKVPAGATHYADTPNGVIYYKIINDVVAGVWSNPFCFWNKPMYAGAKTLELMFGEKFKEIPMKKEESDLDWLARNVHEWPDVITGGILGPFVSTSALAKLVDGNVQWLVTPAAGLAFTKEQWATRRAELQNKPLWKDAPARAEWMAQHSSGNWGWGSGKATAVTSTEGGDQGTWYSSDIGVIDWSGCAGEVLGDWRDTLERRPEEPATYKLTDPFQENIPVCVKPELFMPKKKPSPSGEAANESTFLPVADDDWFERGELPPVGEKCVLHAAENNGEEVMFIGVTSDSFPVFETDQKRVFVERGKYKFSPIQTERQRTITGIVDIMIGTPANENMTATERLSVVAGVIYDKFISKKEGAS